MLKKADCQVWRWRVLCRWWEPAETPRIEPEAAAVTNIWVRLKRDYQQAKTSPKLIQVTDLEIFLRNTYICKKKRVCVGPE